MPWTIPSFNALPGMQYTPTQFVSLPRDIFYSDRNKAQFFSPPPAVDGTASSNPQNSPYVWQLWAGQIVAKESASNIFATSILGQSTVALTTIATTIVTDVNTATEVVRRLGGSGTLTLTGPPTSGGTVASATVTYSAVNTSNGHITISATGVAFVAGSWIGPVDGTQLDGTSSLYTLIGDINGVKVIDQLNTTRVNGYADSLYAGGGIINVNYIVNYPADTAMQAYLKAAIRKSVPNAVFSDDFTG